MIKEFFSNPYARTSAKTAGAHKLASHVKTKQLIADVGSMVKASKQSGEIINAGIFFDGESVVITVAVDKSAFLNQLGGMTSDGLADVMATAAETIANARQLPTRQRTPGALVETLPPEDESSKADAVLKEEEQKEEEEEKESETSDE